MSFQQPPSESPYVSPQSSYTSSQHPISAPHDNSKKHAGFGIASLVASLIGGLLAIATIAFGAYLELSQPNGLSEEEGMATMLIGFTIIGACGLHLFGIMLGVIGLLQYDRKKLFAILGMIFNLMVILGVGILIIIGLAV